MKVKSIIFYILYLFILGLVSGCDEKEITAPVSGSNKYISFKSDGCTPSKDLSKVNEEVSLICQLRSDTLKIEAYFTSYCSASPKDSVLISGNIINIFLADTNKYISRCICPFKTNFLFNVKNDKEVRILFNYKSALSNEYFLSADTTIKIN